MRGGEDEGIYPAAPARQDIVSASVRGEATADNLHGHTTIISEGSAHLSATLEELPVLSISGSMES
jgi:hypothetical protein